MNIESCNVHTACLRLFLVGDGELQMVIEVKLIVGQSSVAGRSLETNGEPTDGIVEFLAPHENWKAIKGHVNSILSFNEFLHPANLLGLDVNLTHRLASKVFLDLHDVGSRLQLQTLETGTKIFTLSALTRRGHFWNGASWQVVKLKRHLGLLTVYQVGVHQNFFIGIINLRRHSREENRRQIRFTLSQDSLSHFLAKLILSHGGRLCRMAHLVLTLTTKLRISLGFLSFHFRTFLAGQLFRSCRGYRRRWTQ
mmetsp:Transcript_28348/g.47049  ORF Transcript_28348/g.47049 Transcript_28348/m.47049 type:complete len:253 (+) Transcript_28348:1248-2006(+)